MPWGFLNITSISLTVALVAVAWGYTERAKRLTAVAEKATAVAMFAEASNINRGNKAVLDVLQTELTGCSEQLARSLQRYADAEREHQSREASRVAALRATQQELNRVLSANREWSDTRHPADVGRLLNPEYAGADGNRAGAGG